MVNHGKLIVFCLVCFFMTACQTTGRTEVSTISPTLASQILHTPTEAPSPTSPAEITELVAPTEEMLPEVSATQVLESQGRDIEGVREEIEASDGLGMVGSYYAPVDVPPPWPGVLLLHMLGSDRSTWDEFARLLAGEGYAVFALDMRGHGDTGGEADWDLTKSDINQVWEHLSMKQDIDPDRLAIIGASIGANLALAAGANDTDIKTVVLLSPGLDYRGVKTEEAILEYGKRPVLIVASQEDTYSADSSQVLEESAVGDVQLVVYQNAGHGTNMFAAKTGLGELIIDWLRTYLK